LKRNTYRIPLGFLAGAVFLARAEPTAASFLAGALLMVLGETIRFVSAGTLIKFEGVTRRGIYAYVRNPLYVGSFLLGAGACVMGRDVPFAVGFLVAYPLVYRRLIRREEAYLVRRYGEEYARYRDDVPSVFPASLDLGKVFGESAPFLAVKNREYRAVFGMAAVWIILLVKMRYFG